MSFFHSKRCQIIGYVVLVLVVILSGTSGLGAPRNEGRDDWRPEKREKVLESTLVRYYVFSMENPEEFIEGKVPNLREIGPFTYREKRVKQNFKRVGDTQLQYDIHWSMHFLPELTGEGLSEKTEFTNVNVPLATMAEGLSVVGLPKAFNDILMDEVLEAGETLVKYGLNFGDSTFYGYNISLYTAILDDVTQGRTEEQYPELANGKFAFFKNKNGTVTSNYTIQSTPSNPFGPILSFNGKSDLGFWPPHTHCDDVSGALDFFTFPKNIHKGQVFDIFLPENCRTLKLKFVKEEVFREIPVYVYKFPLEQLQNDLGNDETSCYCLNFAKVSDPKCLDYGFMDYAGCSKGAPLLGSFPHFLHANPRHLNNVKGLMPNKSLHESEIMIEPITGTPLYAVRRFQINLKMHPIPEVTHFENQTERIVPLAWFEHILEVPSAVFADVKKKLAEVKKGTVSVSDKGIYQPGQNLTEDLYQNDQSPLEEIDYNDLMVGDRSSFSGHKEIPSSSLSTSKEHHHHSEKGQAINSSSSSTNLFFPVLVAPLLSLLLGLSSRS